ncbi:hypothetical protein [Neokomagataea anthophila]|uniref:Uncharacterized protein n=1 Tax=Neokomagataea anthophila TaxID=2826925 RepID=A0ABS5E4H4_9PROT|nr:hypothetical protein [Neokomagataea anthophila]MBR0558810.1 hypothetical protein [Neokomagataea anthophila]
MENTSFGVFSFLKQSWTLPYLFRRDVFWFFIFLFGQDIGFSVIGHFFPQSEWHRSELFIRYFNIFVVFLSFIKSCLCTVIINRAFLTKEKGFCLIKMDLGSLYFYLFSILSGLFYSYMNKIINFVHDNINVEYFFIVTLMAIFYIVFKLCYDHLYGEMEHV